MSKRLVDIVRRKQVLIDKASRERSEVAKAFKDLRSPFDLSGTIFGLGRTLKSHPMIAAGISSLLVSGYGRNLLKSAGGLVGLWRFILPIWGWWKRRRRTSS